MNMWIRTVQIIAFTLLIHFGSLAIYSGTCITTPLDKRFRRAEAVFIGKYTDKVPEDKTEIQNNKSGLLIFEVIKSWKGIRKEYVGIDLMDFPKSSGTCPILDRFD